MTRATGGLPAAGEQEQGGRALYEHVKAFVRSRIEGGDWLPGDRIPSENELVRQFGVARMTVHRALRELQQEGVLLRRVGVGTFVGEPGRQTSLIDIRNIAEEIAARGRRHSTDIHLQESVSADDELAEAFEADPGAPLSRVVLVHREDDVAVQLEDRYVNALVVPEFLRQDFGATTPTAYLLATLRPEELEHTVTATLPDETERDLLGIDDDEPCLSLRRRSWSSGRVVTVATLLYPASRYSLVGRHRPGR